MEENWILECRILKRYSTLYSANPVHISHLFRLFNQLYRVYANFSPGSRNTGRIYRGDIFPWPPPGIFPSGGDQEGSPPVSCSFWTTSSVKSCQRDLGSVLCRYNNSIRDRDWRMFCSAPYPNRYHLASYWNPHIDRL
jgi:hypothetical protein